MWLTISFHKSFIAKKKVNLLGSEITAEQIQPKQKRISKLLALPPPKNVSQLRAWLGALRYTTEMVPNRNISLRHFDTLTGKVPSSTASSHAVVWTRELLNDYKQVRELLRHSTPVYTFDESLETFIETDASEIGFGAVLYQKKKEENIIRPLSYYSEKWKTETQRHDNACFRELLALRKGLEKHQSLLMGTPFTIVTDNMGVFHMLQNFKSNKPKIGRWLNIIASFPFNKVQHKTSGEMIFSDGVSRGMEHQEVAEPNDIDLLPIFAINQEEVFFKRTSEDVKVPSRGTEQSAGWDLYVQNDHALQPGSRYLFKTGIQMEIPQGWYGRIAPRSGTALRNGITVLCDTIDSDYRKDVGVLLYNSGKEPFEIKKHMRIAQIIFQPYLTTELKEKQKLSSTTGDGFGSTGVFTLFTDKESKKLLQHLRHSKCQEQYHK